MSTTPEEPDPVALRTGRSSTAPHCVHPNAQPKAVVCVIGSPRAVGVAENSRRTYVQRHPSAMSTFDDPLKCPECMESTNCRLSTSDGVVSSRHNGCNRRRGDYALARICAVEQPVRPKAASCHAGSVESSARPKSQANRRLLANAPPAPLLPNERLMHAAASDAGRRGVSQGHHLLVNSSSLGGGRVTERCSAIGHAQCIPVTAKG